MELDFPTSREAFRRPSGCDFPRSADGSRDRSDADRTDDSDGFLGWPSGKSSAADSSYGGRDADVESRRATPTDPYSGRKLDEPRHDAPDGTGEGHDKGGGSERASGGGDGEGGDADGEGDGDDESLSVASAALEFQRRRRNSMGSQRRNSLRNSAGSQRRKSRNSLADDVVPTEAGVRLSQVEMPAAEAVSQWEEAVDGGDLQLKLDDSMGSGDAGGRRPAEGERSRRNSNSNSIGGDADEQSQAVDGGDLRRKLDDSMGSGDVSRRRPSQGERSPDERQQPTPNSAESFDVGVPTKAGDHLGDQPREIDSGSLSSGDENRYLPQLDKSEKSIRSSSVLRELRKSLQSNSSKHSSFLESIERDGSGGEEEEERTTERPGSPLPRRVPASAARHNSELLESLKVTLSKQAEYMVLMDQINEGDEEGRASKPPASGDKPIVGWSDKDNDEDDSMSSQSRDKTFCPALQKGRRGSSNGGRRGWASGSLGWAPPALTSSHQLKSSLDRSTSSFCSSLKASQRDSYGPLNGQVWEDFGTRPTLGRTSSMDSNDSNADAHNRNNLLMMMEEEYDPKKPWRKAPPGSSPGAGAPDGRAQQRAGCGRGGFPAEGRRISATTGRSSFTSDMSFGEMLQEMQTAHPSATSALDSSSVERGRGEDGGGGDARPSPTPEEERTAASSSGARPRRRASSGGESAFRASRASEVASALSDTDCSELTELRQAHEVLFPVPESVSAGDADEADDSGRSGASGGSGASDDGPEAPFPQSPASARLSSLDIVQEEQPQYHDQESPASGERDLSPVDEGSDEEPAKEQKDRRSGLMMKTKVSTGSNRHLELTIDPFQLDDLPTSSCMENDPLGLKRSKVVRKEDDDSISYSDIDGGEHCNERAAPTIKMCMTVRNSMIEREFATETMRDVEYGDRKPDVEEEGMTLGMLLNPRGDADQNMYDPMMGGNPHHDRDDDSDDNRTSRTSSSRKGSFIKKTMANQTKRLDTGVTKKMRRRNKRLWKFCVWNCRKIVACVVLGLVVLAGIAALAWWGATKVTGKGNDDGGGDDGDGRVVLHEGGGGGGGGADANGESVAPTGPGGRQWPPPASDAGRLPAEERADRPSRYPSSSPSLRGSVGPHQQTGNETSPPPNYVSPPSPSPALAPSTPINSITTSKPTYYSYTSSEDDQNLTSPAFTPGMSQSPSINASSVSIIPSQNDASVPGISPSSNTAGSFVPYPSPANSTNLPLTYPSSSPSVPAFGNESSAEALSANSTGSPSLYPSSSPSSNNTLSINPPISNSSSIEDQLANTTESAALYPSSSPSFNTSSVKPPISNASYIEDPSANATDAASLYPSSDPSSNTSLTEISNAPSIEAPPASFNASSIESPSGNSSSPEDPSANATGAASQDPNSSPSFNTSSVKPPISNASYIEDPSANATDSASPYPSSDPSSNTSLTEISNAPSIEVPSASINASSIESPSGNSSSLENPSVNATGAASQGPSSSPSRSIGSLLGDASIGVLPTDSTESSNPLSDTSSVEPPLSSTPPIQNNTSSMEDLPTSAANATSLSNAPPVESTSNNASSIETSSQDPSVNATGSSIGSLLSDAASVEDPLTDSTDVGPSSDILSIEPLPSNASFIQSNTSSIEDLPLNAANATLLSNATLVESTSNNTSSIETLSLNLTGAESQNTSIYPSLPLSSNSSSIETSSQDPSVNDTGSSIGSLLSDASSVADPLADSPLSDITSNEPLSSNASSIQSNTSSSEDLQLNVTNATLLSNATSVESTSNNISTIETFSLNLTSAESQNTSIYPSLPLSSNATSVEFTTNNATSIETPTLNSTSAPSQNPTSEGNISSIEPLMSNASMYPSLSPSINTSYPQPSQGNSALYESIQTISGAKQSEYAGASISINPTGEFIAAGFKGADGPVLEKTGLVRVYRRSDNGKYYLFGSDSMFGTATGDEFGSSVSISNDGKRVAVGARSSSSQDRQKNGQVSVFEYSETSNSWIQLGRSIQGLESKHRLGFSVSMSGDGARVAVGAPRGNGGTGSASLHEYDGTDWTLFGDGIVVSENVGDRAGFSVSLSNDGSTLAVGAFASSRGDLMKNGSVSVYTIDSSSSLVNQGGILVGPSDGAQFGYSVSLSGDGQRLVVGSIGFRTETTRNVGLCEVYKLQERQNWTRVGALVGNEENERVGSHVSMSNAGSVVSCSQNTFVDGNMKGMVAVLEENDQSEWNVVDTMVSSSGNSTSFGISTSLSHDGKVLLAGAPSYDSSTGFFEFFARKFR